MFTALKIFTTVTILAMTAVVWFFLMNAELKDRATVIGFSFMELVYVLSLICIWG